MYQPLANTHHRAELGLISGGVSYTVLVTRSGNIDSMMGAGGDGGRHFLDHDPSRAGGVGLWLRRCEGGGGGLTVRKVLPGGPAAKSGGLDVGDTVVSVDGVDSDSSLLYGLEVCSSAPFRRALTLCCALSTLLFSVVRHFPLRAHCARPWLSSVAPHPLEISLSPSVLSAPL